MLGKIPLYSAEMIDDTTLSAIGDAALGIRSASFWAADLPNAANERFVADFLAKYHRIPSAYAAQAYDAVMLLDSAVSAVGGRIEDKPALRAALQRADFKSVRGKFRFNNNHFPIEDWYLVEAAKRDDGRYMMKLVRRLETDHEDAYHAECKLK